MRRLVVAARLNPGVETKAAELIDAGPPFDPAALGLEHHAVYLSDGAVVFVFEGPEVDSIVEDIAEDPSRSPVFAYWLSLLDGAPEIAHELYSWDRGSGRHGEEFTHHRHFGPVRAHSE